MAISLELPGSVKTLNPVPSDPRTKTLNLALIANDPTYYIGFSPIFNEDDSVTYRISGGDATSGWIFTEGTAGPIGPQGIQGVQGVQGNDGLTGDKGETGDTGLTGIVYRGDWLSGGTYIVTDVVRDTADGNSYHCNAPTATVGIRPSANLAQWSVFVMKGAKGDTGNDGLTGAQGIQGIQGVQGNAGTNGTNGTNGSDGAIGNTGAAGANGSDGVDGVDGATGPQGLQGATGIDGIQGIQGNDGAKGDKGDTGVSGVNYRGNWELSTQYVETDVVRDTIDGNAYYCDVPSATVGLTPSSNLTQWSIFVMRGAEGEQGVQGVQGIQG